MHIKQASNNKTQKSNKQYICIFTVTIEPKNAIHVALHVGSQQHFQIKIKQLCSPGKAT